MTPTELTQEIERLAEEKYPTRFVQSAFAYDDDFEDHRSNERRAFKAGAQAGMELERKRQAERTQELVALVENEAIVALEETRLNVSLAADIRKALAKFKEQEK